MTHNIWNYKGLPVTEIQDMPEGSVGFVYVITDRETGKYYIGKKSLYSTVRKPPLKGYKRKRVITKESNWKVYQSSSKEVQSWIDPERKILTYCKSKKELTYREIEALIKMNVLEDDASLNENISGKFFKHEFSQ